MAFGSFSASGFEFTSSGNGAFPFSDDRKVKNLPNGYVAVPTWSIRRANQTYTPEEASRANLMTFDWEVKGTSIKAQQRCPAVWVDNFCFLYTRGMVEPELLLGRWKKDVVVYGSKQSLEGLVIAGGGHYERCANKPKIQYTSATFEQGDMSLRAAADKELKEEIGIDPVNIKLLKNWDIWTRSFQIPDVTEFVSRIYDGLIRLLAHLLSYPM